MFYCTATGFSSSQDGAACGFYHIFGYGVNNGTPVQVDSLYFISVVFGSRIECNGQIQTCFSIALYFFLFSISFNSSISFFKWFTSAYISGSFLYTTLERAKFLASMAGEPCTVMCPLRMLPAIPA